MSLPQLALVQVRKASRSYRPDPRRRARQFVIRNAGRCARSELASPQNKDILHTRNRHISEANRVRATNLAAPRAEVCGSTFRPRGAPIGSSFRVSDQPDRVVARFRNKNVIEHLPHLWQVTCNLPTGKVTPKLDAEMAADMDPVTSDGLEILALAG
jgi:hypothetical protein